MEDEILDLNNDEVVDLNNEDHAAEYEADTNRRHGLKSGVEPLIIMWLFFSGAFVFWEGCLHYIMFKSVDANITFVVLFSFVVAGFINYVLSFFNRKVSDILGLIFMLFFTVYYFAQNVYFRTFQTVMPLNVIGLGGDALNDFSKETMSIIMRYLPSLILVFIPLILYVPVAIFLKHGYDESHMVGRAVFSGVQSLLVYALTMMAVFMAGTDSYTPYDMYFSPAVATETSAEVLGVFITSVREVRGLFIKDESSGFTANDLAVIGGENTVEEAPAEAVQDLTFDVSLETEEAFVEEILPVVYGPNAPAELRLPRVEGNDDINQLSAYFEKVTPTDKNEFTGIFKDKNLIMMCCEAFSPVIIDAYPEMFPALNRLYNQGGFKFENFYASWPNNTTNGEYTYVTGLFPDMSRGKDDSTMANSGNNYYPYVFGNVFSDMGVETYAYHNFRGYYYNREESYPNLGFKHIKFKNAGLNMSTGWPTSDLEMMQQSVDDYINEDRFFAYYMTFSGHMEYSVENNPMCARNYDKVADLELSEPAKCYLSGHLELEYAMEYLLQRLEEAGKLENTVIVMTPDHYPYGLTIEEYSEIVGHPVDAIFEKFENAFICFDASMESKSVDTYCCTLDIMPTLLNLFGVEFDSRILPGVDIFAPSDYHIAVLSNQCFIDENVEFNAAKKKANYKTNAALPVGYLDERIQLVKNKVYISSLVFNSNYYECLR